MPIRIKIGNEEAMYLIQADIAFRVQIAPDKGFKTMGNLNDALDDVKGPTVNLLNGIVSKGTQLGGKGQDSVADVNTCGVRSVYAITGQFLRSVQEREML